MDSPHKKLRQSLAALRDRYEEHDQGHVFDWLTDLTTAQKESVLADLEEIDLERVARLHTQAYEAEKHVIHSNLKPFPTLTRLADSNADQIKEWRTLGLKACSNCEVAVLLLAGGQGTRLGSKDPKGMYDIGLPSHKSLFQLQAERILRLQILAAMESSTSSHYITWYIMTSPATDARTRQYFAENDYFGLSEANVQFFVQGTLPCMTTEGKIIMESGHKVARAPDGNGGVYRAVLTQGVLTDMRMRGVKHIHCYGVDNCLVKVGDPVFLGFCIAQKAVTGVKAVTKAYPTEPVGVVCLNNDKVRKIVFSPAVVEYTELSESLANAKDSKDNLVYSAGNIANHYYTLECLEACAKEYETHLAYHIAQKKIKHASKTGETVTPDKKNGIKLELFIFDILPLADSVAVLEVSREEEFSPLKNAPGTGVDAPETARRDLLTLHAKWLKENGAIIEDGVEVEVSPLRSYGGEFLDDVVFGRTYRKLTVLRGPDEQE